ncbi:MAG: purine-cytosine permease family protein [Thermocladium sp.]
MEKLGIEHIPPSSRHGGPLSQFTLWLASNLTVADYGLGAILFTLGLPLQDIIAIIIIGNVFGALLVGLLAAMGPEFGYPQMMISRGVFGRLGNVFFAAANWVSTIGWFSINAIIGGYLLSFAVPSMPLQLSIVLSVAAQFVIALYGYDAIHKIEKWLSIALGLLFAAAIIMSITAIHGNAHIVGGRINPTAVAIGLATTFSYIMSWGPYASDYSRYLPEKTSKLSVIIGAMLGGTIASALSEAVGLFASIAMNNASGSPVVLAQLMGKYGSPYAVLAIIMLFLGALAANVLNLYTNSLSAVVLYPRIKRQWATILAVVAGIALALIGGLNFENYFEGFLFLLDYWITPWIGVIIGNYYLRRSVTWRDVETPIKARTRPLLAYIIGLLASMPFMNLDAATGGLVPFIGPLSSVMGGADISYFVSFAVALVLSII